MDEKARKRIIYVIFFGAVAFGVINLSGRKPSSTAEVDQANLPQALAEVSSMPKVGADSVDSGEWGRDPFAQGRSTRRPDGAAATTGIGLRLTAVSESGGRMLAVINGHVVSEGETVSGWRVINLTTGKAVIEMNGRQTTLTIGD